MREELDMTWAIHCSINAAVGSGSCVLLLSAGMIAGAQSATAEKTGMFRLTFPGAKICIRVFVFQRTCSKEITVS
jgi:hypothetical protein